MSASLLVHIPPAGDARSGVDELARLLVEEADGLFGVLRFEKYHLDTWQAWLEEHAPDIARMVAGAPTEEETRAAELIGSGFAKSFADETAGAAIRALEETTGAEYRSARLNSDVVHGLSAIHDALADPVLPDEQRRSMIRCMYGVLIGAAGKFELPLQVFTGPESENSSESGRRLQVIATDLATPDTLTFQIWNDCLELLRARSYTASLAADSAESLTPASGNGIAILRGVESSAPIVVLANPTSDVIEISVDRRLLPGSIGTTFRDEITGDMLFVPDGGDNHLSLDLEPYEVVWLSLQPEVDHPEGD